MTTIQLKNARGEIVKQSQYNGPKQRQAITDHWKKIYGKKYEELIIWEPGRQQTDEGKAVVPEKSPWKDGIRTAKLNKALTKQKRTQGGKIW